jgi:hypothetical protein
MFRLGVTIVLLLFQVLVYWRLAIWLKGSFPNHRKVLWILRILSSVFTGAAIYVLTFRPDASSIPVWTQFFTMYPFFIWHGATIFLGIIFLVSLIVRLPFQAVFSLARWIPSTKKKIVAVQTTPQFKEFDASRRSFIRRGMYGLTAASFGGSAYGFLVEKSNHEFTKAHFPISNLSPALEGFTITLISDIHSSPFMLKAEMKEYVRLVNKISSDMIVVDGDFVNSNLDEVYPFAEAFSDLTAPLGVYGVMGNHDFYNANPELVAREVDECGIKLLRNDKTTIEKGDGKFYLVGVDDVGRARSVPVKLDEAMGVAPLNIPKILLCHRPYYLEQAADKDIDLVLSGHTHGGQVVLGRFGDVVVAPASLASRYVWGKYRFGKTHMYVSRGIGTVGLPIRLNCPPEITQITLTRA